MSGCKNEIFSFSTKELHRSAMRNLYHRLLRVIALATQKELARYVSYLTTENQVLRSRLPERVLVTPQERRRLVRFARHLRGALDELVSIVHPDTVRRWIREEAKTPKRPPTGRGRRPTKEEIRDLILLLAAQNGWGYTKPHPQCPPLRFA
jgi:putative transposase